MSITDAHSKEGKEALYDSVVKAFHEGRVEVWKDYEWVVTSNCPDWNADWNMYRIVPKQEPVIQDTKQTNPMRYTKELHLQHLEAFWNGNLEQWTPGLPSDWSPARKAPEPHSFPEHYRIKQPQKLRQWKPEEIPLGAWIREKGFKDTHLIVAVLNGQAVHVRWDDHYNVNPTHLLSSFEHSTDQGKTWLPCGVEE